MDIYLNRKNTVDMPWMIAYADSVSEVNIPLLNLTGYEEKDFVGMKIEKVWKQLLRISVDYLKVKDLQKCDCYMFDIECSVKEVTIEYYGMLESDQGIFTFLQKKNNMFDEKYPFLELANSANDTGLALYSVPDFILLKANDDFLVYFSKQYKTLKQVLGFSLESLTTGWKNSEIFDIFMYVVETGQPLYFHEKLIELFETGSFYSRSTLTPIFEEGEVKYLVQIHNDVTEKVINREAVLEKNSIIEEQKKSIEAQRDYLNKLFNALELPIMSLSYPDFKILEFNKKAMADISELTGAGDVLIECYKTGRSLKEVGYLIENLSSQASMDEVIRTKSTICQEMLEMTRNGHKSYYNITYHPFLNTLEEITEILLVGVDVTNEIEKRKQIEDVLKLKDEFFYLMSHEFKTPLTVINAAVQSLENIYSSQIPFKARVLIGKIKQNAFRQLRLVNNLLDITKINAGQLKLKKRNIDIVFLARAITESVAIYAQQKDVEIVFATKLTQRVIGIDDEKFERILLNLLSNAIKYTPSGKKIAVELFAKLNKNKRMICIKVKDQGVGIPKEKQSLIFERFGQVDNTLTRQSEGSGIGLYLVKLMMNALGGEIFLESESGKGSVFTLMIPSKKAKKNIYEWEMQHISDSRIVQSIATEFSDIYL